MVPTTLSSLYLMHGDAAPPGHFEEALPQLGLFMTRCCALPPPATIDERFTPIAPRRRPISRRAPLAQTPRRFISPRPKCAFIVIDEFEYTIRL